MVDLNVYVSDLLKTIAPVELASNSDSDEKIPCIVIEQYSNSAAAVLENKEFLSDVYFQTDVYGRTPKETNRMAVEVSEAMTGSGFVRTAGRALNACRYMMTFRVRVDEWNNHFYQ